MNAQEIKQKLLMGQLSDEEFAELISKGAQRKRSGSFLKTLLGGFIKGYTEPQILKTVLDAVLLLALIAGLVVLAALHVMEVTVASVLLASVLGYLFGKLR